MKQRQIAASACAVLGLWLLIACEPSGDVSTRPADSPPTGQAEPAPAPPAASSPDDGRVTVEPYTGPLVPHSPAPQTATPPTPTPPPPPEPTEPARLSPEPSADDPAETPPATTLRMPPADRTVSLNVGQTFRIRLAGNPTTGYAWSVQSVTGGALAQVGQTVYEKDPQAGPLGGGGFFTTRFEAVRPGSSLVTLIYARPWEADQAPQQTFTVRATATPAPPLAGERGLAGRSDLARRIAEALPKGWAVMNAGAIDAPPGWTPKGPGEWFRLRHAWLRYRYDKALPADLTFYLMPLTYTGQLDGKTRDDAYSAWLIGQNRTHRLFLRGLLPPRENFREIQTILQRQFGFRPPASVAPDVD